MKDSLEDLNVGDYLKLDYEYVEEPNEEIIKKACVYIEPYMLSDVYSWQLKYLFFMHEQWRDFKRLTQNFLEYAYHRQAYDGSYLEDKAPYLKPLPNLQLEESLEQLERNIYFMETKCWPVKINLSLFLWTIYKIYHLYRDLDTDFIIPARAHVFLFPFLIELFNRLKLYYLIDESNFNIQEERSDGILSKEDKLDVIFLCQQLLKDLIYTISQGFPDYYKTNIMFLSGPYRIPGGCSELTANMDSFENFLRGITDYDYWFDEDIDGNQGNGEELLFKKLKINMNYEEVKNKVNERMGINKK